MNEFLGSLNKLWNLDEVWNIQDHWNDIAVWGTVLFTIIVVGIASGWIVRVIIGGLIGRLVARTKTQWDEHLFDKKFFSRLGSFLPSVACYFLFQTLVTPVHEAGASEIFTRLLVKVMLMWICFSGNNFVVTLINNFEKGFLAINGERRIPIRSYAQVVKLLLFLITGILVVSVLLDQNPAGILAGLGALTAVLLLVFKDALLGLVASVQLNTNNLVQIGDWIEFPGSNIEGEVIDIALSVVKVRSGDNTVYSLPTYNLISVPFKNWRNVKEIGARRLKLAFPVDSLSLAPVSPELKLKLEKAGMWKVPSGHDGVTNLEAYRYWASDYLDAHASVYLDQPRVVKIGDPTGRGVPVEMVFYSTLVTFPDWELLRSELYCHYLASLPEFGLKVFQEPIAVTKG